LTRRTGRSRTEISALIRSGRVRVDGKPAKPAHKLKAGERVEADMTPRTLTTAARPEPIPLQVVFEDEELLVVDKPAGMAAHPAPGVERGTLVNALLAHVRSLPSAGAPLRPGIVHRLDKDTSGLLVVAKSERAMRALSAAIAAHRVEREYDAVVWDVPETPAAKIDAPLARDPNMRVKFAVRHEGKRAVTHFRTIETYTIDGGATEVAKRRGRASRIDLQAASRGRDSRRHAALLRLTLETGRTHQIRVHCAAIGHPIVGDSVYAAGYPDLGMHRQALHAARLRFLHPVSGAPLSFESPWPDDFAALVARLRSQQSA